MRLTPIFNVEAAGIRLRQVVYKITKDKIVNMLYIIFSYHIETTDKL